MVFGNTSMLWHLQHALPKTSGILTLIDMLDGYTRTSPTPNVLKKCDWSKKIPFATGICLTTPLSSATWPMINVGFMSIGWTVLVETPKATMEQKHRYGSIAISQANDHGRDENQRVNGHRRLDIGSFSSSASFSSYQEYDMTYLIAPKLSLSQKLERCFRFTVPLLIGALILGAAGILFSSSAVRCGGYPTDPKFCFKKDDGTTTSSSTIQTTKANALEESGTTTSLSQQKFQKNASAADFTTTPQVKDPVLSVDESHQDVSSSSRMALCVQNSECNNLGLQGECCPTTTGVFLGCCAFSSSSSKTPPPPPKPISKNSEPPQSTISSTPNGIRDTSPDPSSSSLASCASNPHCQALGLLGDCCPTSKGIQLTCCHV